MNIFHLIVGLGMGGAERSLYKIVKSDRDNAHVVVSLTDLGVYGEKFKRLGVDVYALKMRIRNPLSFIFALLGMFRVYLKCKPDIISAWMYHASLFSMLLLLTGFRGGIVWNIRHSNIARQNMKMITYFIVRLLAKFSSIKKVKFIVYNSESARESHNKVGFLEKKSRVIFNGYDECMLSSEELDCVKFNKNKFKIACVARWNIQKDHENLIKALGLLNEEVLMRMQVFLVGPGMTLSNSVLVDMIEYLPDILDVQLVGEIERIDVLFNAIDLHILSSLGESFPNVVAESMRCGVPNVCTDVGDARYIIGHTGWVVHACDHEALSNSIDMAFSEYISDRDTWGERKEMCIKRIKSQFSLDMQQDAFRSLFVDTVNHA